MSTTFTSPTLQNILKGSRVFVFDLVQLYWSYVDVHKGKSKIIHTIYMNVKKNTIVIYADYVSTSIQFIKALRIIKVIHVKNNFLN